MEPSFGWKPKDPPPGISDHSLMPILSLMLILIPLLVGNLSLARLRSVPAEVPERLPAAAGTAAVSTLLYYLTLDRTTVRAEVVEEETGRIVSRRILPLLDSTAGQVREELNSLLQRPLPLGGVLVSSAPDVPYARIFALIESCQGIGKPGSPPVPVVVVPGEES